MTDADDLPEGWTTATIEDLCVLNPKHPRTLSDATEVSFVPMAAVSDTEGTITGAETRRYGEVKKGYKHFADGDVIFAKITPCMENGKAASVRGMRNGLACGTTEFFVFRSRGAIDQDYLFRFIRRESYRKAARATMQSGVGQARVPKEFVLNTEIPLPPLAEQRRIVERIEELLERTRTVRSLLEGISGSVASTVLGDIHLLDQSFLAKAFRGELVPQDPADEPASVLLDRIRWRLPTPSATAIPWARASRFVLMLLRKWKNRAAADLVNRGLMLMLNDDLRGRLLRPNRTPAGSKSPAVPTHWFPRLVEEMVGFGHLKPPTPRGETLVLEVGTAPPTDAVPAEDCDRLTETLRVLKVIDDATLAAELAEAANGQESELAAR